MINGLVRKMKRKNQKDIRPRIFEHWHKVAILLSVYDVIVVTGSYFIGLWFRFDCNYTEIPEHLLLSWVKFAPIYALVSVLVMLWLRLYQSVWRFASFVELGRAAAATAILSAVHVVLTVMFFEPMPVVYYVVGAVLQLVAVVLVRFSYRFLLLLRATRAKQTQSESIRNVMLIGAGEAGQMLLRDLNRSDESNERVCCIIDDNKNLWGRFIDGVPVVGGRDEILHSVEKYGIKKILLVIPSATPEQRRDILNVCNETGCELKNLPSAYRYVPGNITASAVVDVNVEDLLGRDSVKVDMEEISEFISGKVILVTGGGGSIGSELCRQLARHKPKQLIVFDIYENNAHAIGLELKDNYPELNLEVLIGSVRDSKRISQVFEKYKPDVVYHAAAHKHVPLMEDSPCESIKNNAIGTYKTAYAAMKNGCRRFVLISTDKAVNPTNIMGASKRLCEMIIQSFDKKIKDGKADELAPLHVHSEDSYGSMMECPTHLENYETEFVAVRFGNVLGSNGSVIPRFKEQIAKGGPVTVTHPDIIRYFMTIPEAASLVLQAGTYAKGGEIFVLDMGAPVKIDTLARNLIRLSGFVPDVDIKISYTGLRPGEKLYEEKLMSEEGLRTTPNKLIHIGRPIPFDTDTFLTQLGELMNAAYNGREDIIRDLVAEVVPTFHPAGEHGSEEKGDAYENLILDTKKALNV